MASIVPTVGRVVLCWDVVNNVRGLPAIITRVWGDKPDSCVNVHVLGDGANEALSLGRTSVRVLDPEDPNKPDGAYCTWIPYQKGQAARTEKAEALVAELQASPRMDPELAKAATETLTELRDLLGGWREFAAQAMPTILAQLGK